MDRRIPDTATVEAAVALALRAPSAGNAQPWCWRIGYSTLHLFADQDRPLPVPGPGERDMLLGCGAALHHVRVAFAALGWSTDVRRLPDPDDPAHLAVVTPHPAGRPTEEMTALAAAIPRRRTDRRPPAASPVPRDHLDALARAAAREDARLHVVTGAVRGPVRNRRPGTVLTRPPALEAGGEVLVLTTATDDRMALLRAGEATSAVLLSATALGLASCPLTDPWDSREPQLRVLLRVGWARPGSAPLPPTPRRPLGHVLEPLQAPPKYHHRLDTT